MTNYSHDISRWKTSLLVIERCNMYLIVSALCVLLCLMVLTRYIVVENSQSSRNKACELLVVSRNCTINSHEVFIV
jgi:hypothetical protein